MPTALDCPAPPPARAPAADGLRLLADLPPAGVWQTLAQHRTRYPAPPVATGRPLTALIDEIDRAGLRGRGGAGFPTATKMRSVISGRTRPIVVVNATEGEPASFKDKLLAAAQPHLVIDGALYAAAAVGADRVILGVERTARGALSCLHRALGERAASERSPVSIQVAETPPGYVSGEESALVGFLNGGAALPTTAPPRPFERGVAKRPTLVNNIETLAHVAQIATRGAPWFRRAGTPEEPGTMLVSISGAVAQCGVAEVALGTPLSRVVEQAAPTSAPGAALVGGFFGTWVPASAFSARLSRAGLSPLGAAPGAGVVIVLPEDACGLAETAAVLRWYAGESAGQCGPCVFGLPALAQEAVALAHGPVPAHGLSRLQRWGAEIEGRGACKHPDGAVRLLRSALRTFAADADAHAQGQPCRGSFGSHVIPVPAPGARPGAARLPRR